MAQGWMPGGPVRTTTCAGKPAMRLFVVIVLALAAIAAGAIGVGLWREERAARRLEAALLAQAGPAASAPVADAASDLPPVVARYLRHALGDAPRTIRSARMRQSGELRTSVRARHWSSFTAEQLVVPGAPGFVWKARVAMPMGAHVRVLDSYAAGAGAVRVSVMSALAVASESGAPELNAGALHRYLAEAVWYPSALLPAAGVRWEPLSERSALATIEDRGTRVSLEFRFNDADEVVAIYTPGRWGRFDGGYRQVAWEGHFKDYRVVDGVRVPAYGEVGWFDAGQWQPVWRGRVVGPIFEFGP
jgi:hypothetical protein